MRRVPSLRVVTFLSIIVVVSLASVSLTGNGSPPCVIATVPDRVPISPDGSIPFTVKLQWCAGGPVEGSVVTLEFHQEIQKLIAWAKGQDHPFLVGTSDADGEATFYIAGSGCIDFSRFTPTSFITQVKADGVLLAEPGVVNSPDVVNSQGLLPPELGKNICENGTSAISLSDAVFFTRPIKLGLVEPCAKFTGPADEPVNLGDAVFLTDFLKSSAYLVCQ